MSDDEKMLVVDDMPKEEQKNTAADGEEDDDEGIFEVEALLEKKVMQKKNFYLVRWKGFGPADDTWEPENNLKETAPEVLDEFKAKERSKKAGSNTPRPPKKRPVPKYESESDSEMNSSKRKESEDSDAEFEAPISKKKSSAKKSRTSTANGLPSATKAPGSAPAVPAVRRAVPKSLNWLESGDDSDSDDDAETKKRKEEDKKRREEEEVKKKEEHKRLREDREREAAERMVAAKIKEEERDAERKAEKERRRAEKEKRREEKKKEKEARKELRPESDTESRSGQGGPIIVRIATPRAETSCAASPPTASSVLPDSTNAMPTANQLTSIIKLKQSRDGIVSAVVLQDSKCTDMTIKDAWNTNPYGLLQYLLSRHQFEEE